MLRSRRFNSVALSYVFYTEFKTMRRNEFLSTAQAIILECGFDRLAARLRATDSDGGWEGGINGW